MDNAEYQALLDINSAEKKLLRKTFVLCGIATITACQLSFMCGAAQGYSAILSPQLMGSSNSGSINIDENEASWIASLGTICRPLGALIEGYCVDKFGRKVTMMIVAVILAVSWISTALSESIVMIYISRISISIGLGMVICVGLYIVEICLPKQRGSFLSMITPITMSGTLVVYLLGSFLYWKTIAMIFAIHCVLMLFTFTLIPESHIWYILNERKGDAIHSLLWLRNGDLSQVSLEMAEADGRTDKRPLSDGYVKMFADRAVWKPFLILTCFSVLQQQAGYNVIIFYAVDFFTLLDSSASYDAHFLSVLFAGVSTVSSTMLTSVVHIYNRKTLLAASGVGMFVTMILAAVSVMNESLKRQYPFLPILFVFCYIFFCMLGMIDIPWMIIGELFPSRVRGTASACVTVVIYLITTIVVKTYSSLVAYLGISGVLCYFAVFSLLSIIFSTIFIPETKDKSLFDIEDKLRNR